MIIKIRKWRCWILGALTFFALNLGTLPVATSEATNNQKRDIDQSPHVEGLGWICYNDGTEKRIKPEGAIWLAKMIDGETWGKPSRQDAEAMLWALIQRKGMWKKFQDWSLQRMVQAYSQPVNPRWTRSGDKCKEYYTSDFKGKIPDNCSVRRVERREKNIAKSWQDTDVVARQTVLDFVSGRLSNHLVGAVGWFAPGTWQSRERNGKNTKEKMVFHSEIDGNIYFSMNRNPNTVDWKGTEVMVVGADSMCPMIITDDIKE